MLERLLVQLPIVEVIIRILYWKSNCFYRLISYLQNMRTKKSTKENISTDASVLVQAILDLGVKPGDTLIIHSAFSEMRRFNVTPEQMIDIFLEIIGEDGNLIMPAIPLFRGQPDPKDRFKLSNYKNVPLYDTKKTRLWTGVLPTTLLKRAGAVRSRSPLNSMAILGPDSSALVDHEFFNESSLPCGEGSVLANSLKFNSKILFLGVDEVHSMTMIHAAEDLDPERWPIKDWYWKRDFEVVDGDFKQTLKLRERDPKWALFYAERRFSADLFSAGVLKKQLINDFNVSLCSSNELLHFLNSKNTKGYPYVIPFWYFK